MGSDIGPSAINRMIRAYGEACPVGWKPIEEAIFAGE